VPGIVAVALNTEKPERIKTNFESASVTVPPLFWTALQREGLIGPHALVTR
jgi:hypothetical protein